MLAAFYLLSKLYFMKKWSFEFTPTFFVLSVVGIIFLSLVGGCGITIYDQTRRAVQADFLEVSKSFDTYYVGILRRNDEENFAAIELTESEAKLLVRMLQTLLDES